jgi:tRNA(Arg) A34 adenosine deaminase TadA
MNNEKMRRLREALHAYTPDAGYRDDPFIHLACKEALEAVREGNFGVGAVITDPKGRIVEKGHNHVFSPYFRSDLHAEMWVLTKLEERNRDMSRTGGHALYSSLEPCPMCLARIISSGIQNIAYAAPDPLGGMVERMGQLPGVWQDLARRQRFSRADCSPALTLLAGEIFLVNADELNEKLAKRN